MYGSTPPGVSPLWPGKVQLPPDFPTVLTFLHMERFSTKPRTDCLNSKINSGEKVAVSIKDGLRTADHGLRTGYEIRTRYKMRTTD